MKSTENKAEEEFDEVKVIDGDNYVLAGTLEAASSENSA